VHGHAISLLLCAHGPLENSSRTPRHMPHATCHMQYATCHNTATPPLRLPTSQSPVPHPNSPHPANHSQSGRRPRRHSLRCRISAIGGGVYRCCIIILLRGLLHSGLSPVISSVHVPVFRTSSISNRLRFAVCLLACLTSTLGRLSSHM
jgi:hypothetical protein